MDTYIRQQNDFVLIVLLKLIFPHHQRQQQPTCIPFY